jgi:hypothetical protein
LDPQDALWRELAGDRLVVRGVFGRHQCKVSRQTVLLDSLEHSRPTPSAGSLHAGGRPHCSARGILFRARHNERYGRGAGGECHGTDASSRRAAAQECAMANQEQIRILKQGVEAWNRWRLNRKSTAVD